MNRERREQTVEQFAEWHKQLEHMITEANNEGVSLEGDEPDGHVEGVAAFRRELDEAQDALIDVYNPTDCDAGVVYDAWTDLVHGRHSQDELKMPGKENEWYSLYAWPVKTGDDMLADTIERHAERSGEE